MPEVKLNLSSPVNSSSIFPVQGWSGIYKVGYIYIHTHTETLSEYVGYLIADLISNWPYPGFVEETGSITFGMLTAADLGLQKMKTGISYLFFWSFPSQFCIVEASLVKPVI